ncbi:MAG: DUF4105 domain-containing protein, partial [Bacteroidaceae bacterium]|nr:DUF4105 domain-containing protein [Bacteroidaceae bacterium]
MYRMKRFLLFCLVAVSFVCGASAGTPKFSVLTCSPGDEAYALYGHTALRYCDEDAGVDVVFNYGCFDFSAPNFAWRFVLGETDYIVAMSHFDGFLDEYALRGSAVVEQAIDLTPEQEAALLRALVHNCRAENRGYRYRYLDNNCTTKVRDMLLQQLSGTVAYEGEQHPATTYRDALNVVASRHPWYAFGFALLLGSDVDEAPGRDALQFLPLNFMKDLEGATVAMPDGSRKKIVASTNVLLAENRPAAVRSNFTPFNASLLLLLGTMIVMLCELRSRKTYWGLDMLLMLLQGLSGALLLFMALFSQHPAVGNNWLLLLLNPLALLLLPVMLYRIRKHLDVNWIAWTQIVFVALFVLSAIAGLQCYPAP